MVDQAESVLAAARQQVLPHHLAGAEVLPSSRQTLDALCQAYQQGPVCLFTGAGVSFTKAKHYRAPGWWDLLMEMYARIHQEVQGRELQADKLRASFAGLRDTYSEPWAMASFLLDELGGESRQDRFTEILREALVRRTTARDPKRQRLPIGYLKRAGTLNAVVAFCSRLRAIRAWPCYVPNPKVRAVLTLNYDCYLEAGATTKYESYPFKPMSSTESKEKPPKLSVYHIHHYIPYDMHSKPRYPLVLTAESYRQAYQSGSFTRQTLDRFLGCYPTLFVGISFDDERLLRRLEGLTREPKVLSHFALLKQGSVDSALLDRLHGSAGVQPILYEEHEQIPAIVGQVYQGGLSQEDLSVGLESKDTRLPIGFQQLCQVDYWMLLLFNKK